MDDETELNELCEFFQQLNKDENNKKHVFHHFKGKPLDSQLLPISSYQQEAEFDRFLNESGGIYGGWHEEHHQHYLHLRNKHNLSSIVYIFRQSFPAITEQEIFEHDKWYTKYLKLKCNRNKANGQRHKEVEVESNEELETDWRSVTSMKVTSKRDESIKIEIQRWKEWKRKMEEERKRDQEIEMEMQRRRNQMKWLEHLHQKKLIADFQMKKLQEMEAFQREKSNIELKEKRIRSATANRMLAVFRKKDESWLQKKQTRKQSAIQAEQDRLNNLHAVLSKLSSKINIDRDPYRLLVPTVEWKQKMRKVDHVDVMLDQAKEGRSNAKDIVNVQHLAVPEWRRQTARRKSE